MKHEVDMAGFDLQRAIGRDDLQLHYQPLVNRKGRLDGFEALVRWPHKTKGAIPPSDFIPLAEQTGIIFRLSQWVLRQACLEAASWSRPLFIAVNLSPLLLERDDLPKLVESVLLETRLAPSRLELEITESMQISDSKRAAAVLLKLRELGVKIALDDFGKGYSGLSYLRDLPVSKIKIDRGFVAKLGEAESSNAIVHAIIALGHALKVSVAAEGVETRQQLKHLIEHRCDIFQGYLFGKPAPSHLFSSIVHKRRTVFYGPDGSLRRNEVGRSGFSHIY